MPSAIASTSTAPASAAGSGTSSSRAEPAWPGITVMARTARSLGARRAWDAAARDPAGYGLEPGAARGGRRRHRPGDVVRRRAGLDMGVRGHAVAGASLAFVLALSCAGCCRGSRPRAPVRSGWWPSSSPPASCGRARGRREPRRLQRAGLARRAGRRARGARAHPRARAAKRLRRRDLADRRQFLTAAAVGAGALVAWQVQRPLQRALGLPGGERRFTGSYDAGSFTGNDFPPPRGSPTIRARAGAGRGRRAGCGASSRCAPASSPAATS